MSETTPRLGLPLLQAGQAQKEVLHNEAITRLDALVPGLVEAAHDDAPPPTPAPGQAWIVGPAPTGDWIGQAGAIALWTEGGWRFVLPVEGLTVRVRSSGLRLERRATGWSDGDVVATALTIGGVQVVGARQPAVAAPAGGATVDAEARGAIAAIVVALRSHGLIA